MATMRLWVASLAGACFLAGGVNGYVLGSWRAAAPEAPEQVLADELVNRYGLRSDQERSLRAVLHHDRARENELRRSIEWGQLPVELQRELLQVHRETTRLIRYGVLDDEQRVRYDRDTQPSTGGATGPAPASAATQR